METYESIINHRRKKSEALVLAIACYICLITPLLVDVASQQTEKTLIGIQPIQPIKQHKQAVPVKYIPSNKAPKVPQAVATPPPITPSATPKPMQAVTQTPASPPAKPSDAKKSPSKRNDHLSPPKIKREKPVPSSLPSQQAAHVQEKINEPAPAIDESYEEMTAGVHRSSRHKWYKEPGDAFPRQPTAPGTASKRKHFNVAQGFYNHMIQEQAEKNAAALSFGGAVDGFEARLFNEKFIVELCRESYMNPLRIHDQLFVAHCIDVEVTCSKQRKVIKVNFITPSQNEQINTYLRNLLNTMTTPILPSEVKADVVTFPIYIFVDQQNKNNLIWFVPGRRN